MGEKSRSLSDSNVKQPFVIPGQPAGLTPESITPQTLRRNGFSDVQLHIKARSLHSRPGMTTRKKSELLSVFAKAAADKSLTLAMTRISHTSTFSQRDPPESCTNPSAHRGRRECRVLKRHPQPHVLMKKAHEPKSPQVQPNHRHSLRDGVNGFLRCSSRGPGFLAPVIGAMREHRRQLDTSIGTASARFPKFVHPCSAFLHELRKAKGTRANSKFQCRLRFEVCRRLAATFAETSNRRHWYHTTSPSALIAVRPPTWRVHRIPRPTSVTTRTPLLSRRDASK